MNEILEGILSYTSQIDPLELAGLIFGLLAVYFLIKENIWTWPLGIAYVLVSFVIFWEQKLYADFWLHVFFLIMNIYGWWFWLKGNESKKDKEPPITNISLQRLVVLLLISAAGIYGLGTYLSTSTDASLPYWDSTTTILSLTGMWLSARKKIENWYFWFVVDVLATGIYFYKGIYFYALLYMIYIVLAIIGFLEWKKFMLKQK
ncbi:nicotinamide riboside transporter PnuC [Fulvivirga sp. RKSG066]|uniref:nicotinamide riboside transporter PnuC n=1 Tax=Fulvivirga aurantia TaxID=2529383 RepID=UPI0012BB787B|nr:nicotinamide riboside transporter PnuC [Fulvivirga aurantia]MTI23300.1 nicotinamide riboside transporter PnuC [Fulvivirga aurantia]